MKIENAIERALRNISKHGDTDIFPFPFETHIFHDERKACKEILLDLHSKFDERLASSPPQIIDTLTQVGYTGFRWASQIEPFWNAYYLALVVSLAEKIERIRLPEDAGAVFSYRYEWQEGEAKLFKDVTWRHYRNRCLELSKRASFVVLTDISDFYPRIYHHRIENALREVDEGGDVTKRIMSLLRSFSKNVSYGLPVGGPASRVLSELALDRVDKHLARRKLSFCRYSDDIAIFCEDRSQAFKSLVLLAEKLFNEGLVLQKKKTRIISSDEFRESAALLDPQGDSEDAATDEQKLLNISLRFDPYSPNATEQYESLKSAVNEIDIVGILAREINKTNIDATVTRHAVNTLRVLPADARTGAIRTLLDKDNLDVLSPVFVTVMRSVKGVYDQLSEEEQVYVDRSLVDLYDSNSHLISVDLNLSYYVLGLSGRHSVRKEEILVELYERNHSPLIRRLIILVMADWRCKYWLSDIKQHGYEGTGDWERRAFIVASYTLGDEGSHWRDSTKKGWSPQETLARDWFAKRLQKNSKLPL